jgi:hypothetical protein
MLVQTSSGIVQFALFRRGKLDPQISFYLCRPSQFLPHSLSDHQKAMLQHRVHIHETSCQLRDPANRQC